MKLYSFLISLAFVKVSTYSIKDYMKDVSTTNAHIQLAYNKKNFTVQEKFILNGLEHVIKKTVEQGLHSLGSMNNMFAVPEYRYFNDWNALREIQLALRAKIEFELEIPAPQEIGLRGFRQVLLSLGQKRREFTRTALKNILYRTINYGAPGNVTNLVHERRLLGSDALENRIIRALAGPEQEISLSWMCYLIALFISTKYPESHIKDIKFNSDGTCTLSDGNTYETYGKIEGQWCRIIGNEVQPLKDLLR